MNRLGESGRHAGNFLAGDKSQAPLTQTGQTPNRLVANAKKNIKTRKCT
jgi:hypothetical protein